MTGSIVGMAFTALVCAGLGYFFLVTRGALIAHAFVPRAQDRFHVYWVYSNMGLIKFSDKKTWVAAVLLFQYDRLVDKVVSEIRRTSLIGKTFLMTSCAFGDVMPKVVKATISGGADRICITDLIKNELIHARKKLNDFQGKVELAEADATRMPQADGTVAVNLIFFLFHELPDASKEMAFCEAMRVTAPGGKLIIAEFHRPRKRIMRWLGRLYFTVFEPFALTMWNQYDPVRYLESKGGWTCERSTYFFGNFQVVTAIKKGP
ncbi:MAG: class I SAM-dependent methyltransferase [Proteobacteria bacterium]|nr:class I SAM-dependent methyltransferase [Pseudomonadota bacterium]